MIRIIKPWQHTHKPAVDVLIDRPTTNDLLHFKRFANPIAEIISRAGEDRVQLTIGIYGEWGSGKTSFLQMVAARLREQGIQPVWFDAWKYDKEDNLWSALLQTILNQACAHGRWYQRVWAKLRIWFYRISLSRGMMEVAQKLWWLAVRLCIIVVCLYVVLGLGTQEIQAWFGVWLAHIFLIPTNVQPVLIKTVVALIGIAAADPLKVIELLKGKLGVDFSEFERKASYRDHIAFLDDFNTEFQRIIRLLMPHHPLVVIIDDLDRCLPDKALLVLEAIKAFLDIQGCVFLLGLDREIVEKAVAIKYKEFALALNDGAVDQRGLPLPKRGAFYEDYMDKIIQLAVVVPQLPETQISDFIGAMNKTNVKEDPDIQRCVDIFGVGLPANPRKIKRILRTFRFVRDVVYAEASLPADEIRISILAKLIVIQNQFPALYAMLPEQPSLLAELERYYRARIASQEHPHTQGSVELANPVLHDRAKRYAEQYPKLPEILLKKIDEDDTFIGANIDPYIYLIGTLAEVRPLHMKALEKEGIAVSTQPLPVASALPTPAGVPVVRPMLWNLPLRRNPFFTDREDILSFLYDHLRPDGKPAASTQPIALCGLGGIGKTEIAVEYAYRYQDLYQAIFWTRADTHETIVSGFLEVAALLQLPERDKRNQNVIVEAVKHWLSNHTGWLFIFDGGGDLEHLDEFLPLLSGGHILITTRNQRPGKLVQEITIRELGTEEGMLLLLRRARIIPTTALLSVASPTDRANALEITRALGGLPLALDQAGAYIDEAGCSLAHYLELYKTQRSVLLQRRGGLAFDHPQPVATTWSIALEKVEQENPAATELLRFCAFLAPDVIPEELLTVGAEEMGSRLMSVATDPLKLNAALRTLIKFSLVHHNPDQTLSMHRLVQAVLKDEMETEVENQWAERAVRVVNRALPAVVYSTWPWYEKCLPQALACADLITQWDMVFPEAARLLNETGRYLYDRAQYVRAEELLRLALHIREKVLGTEHPDVAQTLNNLARLYQDLGKYAEAEVFYLRSLSIRKQALGEEHPAVAQTLNNLARLYHAQGQYDEALTLFERALRIRRQLLGTEHPDVAQTLNNLAELYRAQGKYGEAEPLYQQALAIYEKKLGPEHPRVAQSLNNLALFYHAQGRYEEALRFCQQALEIRKQVLGEEHPEVAQSLNNLAGIYDAQGKYDEAEPLYQQALAIYEKVLGTEHPSAANCLNNLAGLYRGQGRLAEAEPFYLRALEIYKLASGEMHPSVASTLNNLAELYRSQGRYGEAEPLYQQARSIYEKALGSEHPNVAMVLYNLAMIYREQRRYADAEPLYQKAVAIYEKTLGAESLGVANVLENYAAMLYEAKQENKALPLEERVRQIRASHQDGL